MMTFEAAANEQDAVKAACVDLGLDEGTTAFVLASYRRNGDLLHTMLEHGADHRAYIEAKLMLRAAMNDEPEPTFPPRAGG